MPEKNSDQIAEAILDLSNSIRLLGNGSAADNPAGHGAIEGLAMLMRESSSKIAESLDGIAAAIHELAASVENSK